MHNISYEEFKKLEGSNDFYTGVRSISQRAVWFIEFKMNRPFPVLAVIFMIPTRINTYFRIPEISRLGGYGNDCQCR